MHKLQFLKVKRVNNILKHKSILIKLSSLFILIFLYFILYKIYIPRVNAFGCFDDCNNFMRGYFVLQGKELFSEVFSGHQPLGSYISTIIQAVTSPQNIFELVLRHRQFILLFGFIFNFILILRFGVKVILFTLIFELSKFYLFGDRFLGDAMVVYPLIYLLGITYKKIQKEKIFLFDYIVAAVFCWFIIFMREPYIPIALFIYAVFLLNKNLTKIQLFSFVLFLTLSILTIFAHDVVEYFFNVVTFNFQVNIPAEVSTGMFGPKFFQWFFYPFYIFIYGPVNLFKSILIAVNVVFFIVFLHLVVNKNYKLAGFIFLSLGLANIRTIIPGSTFYNAFHMLVWYGLFVFTTITFLFEIRLNRKIFFIGILILLGALIYFVSSPIYFAKEKIDEHTEFITNYGSYLQEGEVIKILSNKKDTLFLDASDDLIYWQAGLPSSYKYSWYTSSMPSFKKYTDARIEMFETNPPAFYREYGFCPKEIDPGQSYRLPDFIKNDYLNLIKDNKPSCLYVKKDKLKDISDDQWKEAATWYYALPKE